LRSATGRWEEAFLARAIGRKRRLTTKGNGSFEIRERRRWNVVEGSKWGGFFECRDDWK
jgi:hypothetical protein